MCFSAQGSFAAAGVLTCIGVASIWSIKSKSYLLFASIPIIFALQQVAEGLLWLSISQQMGAIFTKLSEMVFLSIALIIWPIWVPLSLYVLETNKDLRGILLKLMIILGLLFSIGVMLMLVIYPIGYYVFKDSIVYDIGGELDMPSDLLLVFYCISTVLPFFISSHKSMVSFGIALITALIISLYFKYQQLVSVWCFLAALLSVIVYIIIRWENRQSRKDYG